ncbi:DUF302 domain-containing protein [Rhodobacteraceae bacterium CCMM004]|nr:DUF302 domain-containing protein [Rhodobacteraceae bacterium CCMM004]
MTILRYAAIAAVCATAAHAEGAHITPYDGTFEDAAFAVETAIVNQGLVVDFVSHVGEMLARTGEDVGSDVKLFEEADIFVFCSAVVSREVMEADPMNVAQCPYGIFVAERDGEVMVGYRDFPEGPMDAVETLLSGIVEEAVGM